MSTFISDISSLPFLGTTAPQVVVTRESVGLKRSLLKSGRARSTEDSSQSRGLLCGRARLAFFAFRPAFRRTKDWTTSELKNQLTERVTVHETFILGKFNYIQ
jgi:hypothetical protein